MDRATEDRLLALAVARGDLQIEDLGEIDRTAPAGSGIERLVASGRLPAGAVDELHAGVTRLFASSANWGEPSAPRALGASSRLVVPDELPAGHAVGHYEIVEVIGSGGMGQVYKAFDPALARHVALKILRSDNPELGQRFIREAQGQARIDHPNVCRVYEVGEADGNLFIAMQLIAGQTLGRMVSSLTLEQRLRVLKTVAEAVHEAHRQGLVHRDIKPGNIMVEQLPDGSLTPYILDFGLALDQQAPGLTRSGVIMGTVQYMAPEQARGEVHTIDRRTDVWALGAVLHELVSGVPPFGGGNEMEVMLQVMQEEVPPLRRRVPHLSADLETIIHTCLERQPERRYDSARAVAEELGRYLDGEAIVARPASLLSRLQRKARKHRAVVATAAVFLVVIAALVGVGVRGRLRATERTRLAQRFGQEAERIEGFMRYAYALPLHDVRRERAVVRRRMTELATQTAALGALAEGSGNYALGRAHLALSQPAEAREHLEQAWAAGFRTPETAFALGQALAVLYREELENAQRIPIKELREARRTALQKSLGAPATEYLEMSRQATLESPSYLEGLIAVLDQRFEAALERASGAATEAPWLPEAHLLRGDAFMKRAEAAFESGDVAGGRADLAQAHDAYLQAAEMARSDPRVREALARHALSQLALERRKDSGNLEAVFKSTVAAAESALQADPESMLALRIEATAYLYWGEAQLRRGADPAGALETAEALAARIPKVDRHHAEALQLLGVLAMTRAMLVELRRGLDPRDTLARAGGYFEQALAIDPNLVLAQLNLAASFAVRAEYEIARGLDPRASLRAAAGGLQRVLTPGFTVDAVLNNVGSVNYRLGQWESAHGLDPSPSFNAAISACQQAIDAGTGIPQPHNLKGAAWVGIARFQLSRGHDPHAELTPARAAYQQALALSPTYALAVNNLGEADLVQAEYLIARGLDAERHLASALDLLQKALALNPSFGEEVHNNIARAYLLRGRVELAAGRDPGPYLARARAATRLALQVNPRSGRGLLDEAQAELLASRWLIDRQLSPVSSIQRATVSLARAVAQNPSETDCYQLSAELEELRARWLARHGGDSRGAINTGLAAIERGLAINPQAPRLLAWKGTLTWRLGRDASTVEARKEAARQAETFWKQALALNPLLANEIAPVRQEASGLL